MLITLEGAESLPISVEEAKTALKVDTADNDAEIEASIRAAGEYLEGLTGLVLVPKQLQYRTDAWPCSPLRIPAAPIRDVVAIGYLDEDGILQSVDESGSTWTWQRTRDGADLIFDDDFSAPALLYGRNDAVRVTFEAGFDDPNATGAGDDPELVMPMLAVAAVKQFVAWYHDGDEASWARGEALAKSLRIFR